MKTDSGHIKRFKAYALANDINDEVYIEILQKFEESMVIGGLTGNEYQAADHLRQWGFLGRLDKPIFKGGQFRGNIVLFVHPEYDMFEHEQKFSNVLDEIHDELHQEHDRIEQYFDEIKSYETKENVFKILGKMKGIKDASKIIYSYIGKQ